MAIQVNNLQEKKEITPEQIDLLEKVLLSGLTLHQKEGSEVSVILVDDDYIHELNLEYRGIDQPTDVLSFAMKDNPEDYAIVLPEEIPELLGDIYISIDRTIEQAGVYNHSFERELNYLAIHGLLHLLGFDHQDADDTDVMRKAEEQILAGFSLGRGFR